MPTYTEYALRLTSGRIVTAPEPGGFFWIGRDDRFSGGGVRSFDFLVQRLSDYRAVALTTGYGDLKSATEVISVDRIESVVKVPESAPRPEAAPPSSLVYYHAECPSDACACAVDVRARAKPTHLLCPSCGGPLEWTASTPCDERGGPASPYMLAPRLRR